MLKLKLRYRILILLGVFLIAGGIFFFVRQRKSVKPDEVYSATMEASVLPVVWVENCGRRMNVMHGHTGECGYDIAYDTLTLLSEDRVLDFYVSESDVFVMGADYEIRSIDLEELIEEDSVETFNKTENGIHIMIPVENLIVKNQEYRFDLILNTQEKGKVHYYTRILQTENAELASQMLDLACEFSERNFNYDEAGENTMYMESDASADNTQLEYTDLKSTFTNLAYNSLKLIPGEEKNLRLCIFDGHMGEAALSYIASRELANGTVEYFQIDESFTMRMGAVRLYMMDYTRTMKEIFTGNSSMSGKRIDLGIEDETDIDLLNSSDGKYTYFKAAGDLWCYDSDENVVRNLFSFRNKTHSAYIDELLKHDIRLVNCDQDGNLSFMVYGYMNRGLHEGETGIAYMVYDVATNSLKEDFFIQLAETFEEIDYDINELSYLGSNDILYMLLGHTIYSVDTKSDSIMTIADGVRDGSYAISKRQEKVAWQEDSDSFGSDVVNIMDLDSGQKQEIRADKGVLLKCEGFIGRDLVVSLHQEDDKWMLNGADYMIPAETVEIVDDRLNVLKRYEKTGCRIGSINVHDGRVSMQLLEKLGDNFVEAGEDTIVSSTEAPDRREGIGSANTNDKLRVFYVETGNTHAQGKPKLGETPEIADNKVIINNIKNLKPDRFNAYGKGSLLDSNDSMQAAVDVAYQSMGSVRYKGKLVYNRAGTLTTSLIDDYVGHGNELMEYKAEGKLYSLNGMPLKQVLFFVSSGYPVLAYTDENRACIIYYYDNQQVSLWYPDDGSRAYPSLTAAAEMFENGYNDFYIDLSFD